MKKLALLLAFVGFCVTGALAQNKKSDVACGKSSGKVCKATTKKGKYCYKTPYAQNFDICKNNRGYYVCCQTPNEFNSSFSQAVLEEEAPYRQSSANEWQAPQPIPVSMVAPHSQSYPPDYTPSIK
jgi:hypothetical protein